MITQRRTKGPMRLAVVLGSMILAGIFLLYAFIQKAQAYKSTEMAQRNKSEAIKQQQVAKEYQSKASILKEELEKAEQSIRVKDSIITTLKKAHN